MDNKKFCFVGGCGGGGMVGSLMVNFRWKNLEFGCSIVTNRFICILVKGHMLNSHKVLNFFLVNRINNPSRKQCTCVKSEN